METWHEQSMGAHAEPAGVRLHSQNVPCLCFFVFFLSIKSEMNDSSSRVIITFNRFCFLIGMHVLRVLYC